MTPSLKVLKTEWKFKKTQERIYIIAGGISLAIALASLFIPVLPQIPFAIIAAYFFSKGSDHLHIWIRHHKHLGLPVRDWEDHKVIRPKTKIISTIMMVGGAILGHYKWGIPGAFYLDALFLVCIVFVVTRRSKNFTQAIFGQS